MGIETIGAAARAASEESFEERPLAAVAVGEALERALTDPETLVATSIRLAQVAYDLGCTALMGASPVGERLAAAAVVTARNGLHLYRRGEAEDVLVVDGLMVTGVQIAAAAREARGAGARRAAAAVVAAVNEVDLADGVDKVVVLET